MTKIRNPELNTGPELIKYSGEHLTYEIDMLLFIAGFFIPMQSTKGEKQFIQINSAIVECFVLHFRNLVEFLEPNNLRDDDVIAKDFLPINTELTPLSQRLKDARKRANKEMAHLTTARQFGSPKTKEWSTGLLNDLSIFLNEFIEKADSNFLSPLTISSIKRFILCYPLTFEKK